MIITKQILRHVPIIIDLYMEYNYLEFSKRGLNALETTQIIGHVFVLQRRDESLEYRFSKKINNHTFFTIKLASALRSINLFHTHHLQQNVITIQVPNAQSQLMAKSPWFYLSYVEQITFFGIIIVQIHARMLKIHLQVYTTSHPSKETK